MCSGNLWPLLARSLAALQSGGAIPLTPWLYPLQSGSVWLPHGTGMTPLHSSPIGLDWRHWGHARLASRDRASRVTGQGLGLTPGHSLVQCRSHVESIEGRICGWMALSFAHVSSRAASSAVCYACDNEPCATLFFKLNLFELNFELRCVVCFA